MRRRLDDFLPSADQMSGVGTGTPAIPYDQTSQTEEPMDPRMQDQQQQPVMPDQAQPPAPGIVAGVGAPAPSDSSMLSDQDLSQLAQSPDDQQAAQLQAMLEDPTLPPAEKLQIQEMLATAARRRLAGITGA